MIMIIICKTNITHNYLLCNQINYNISYHSRILAQESTNEMRLCQLQLKIVSISVS
jgi:hypothetical protein